jgi:hypothetical protein
VNANDGVHWPLDLVVYSRVTAKKRSSKKSGITLVMPGVCRIYEGQYELKPLLTHTEMTFFLHLQNMAQGRCAIMCKPRMSDYIERLPGGDLRSINQKHVDFLICRKEDMLPVFAIELDDSSHETAEARKSDKVKNEISSSIGLPLLRVTTKAMYESDLLVKELTNAWFTGVEMLPGLHADQVH